MTRTRRTSIRAATVSMAAVLLLAVGAAACSGDDDPVAGGSSSGTAGSVPVGSAGGPGERIALDGLRAAAVTVVAGTQEVTVTGLAPGQPATLVTDDGTKLLTLLADDAGQVHTGYVPFEHLVFETGGENILPTGAGESLDPGSYRVVVGDPTVGDAEQSVAAPGATVTGTFRVRSVADHPDASFYDGAELGAVQVNVLGEPVEGAEVEDGFGYIETRDGTLLSAMVRLPDPTLYGDGPYPTVVEYSGYDPISNPGGQEPGSRLAQALGFATVGVSMRGTGCSGGAFDVFSPSQQVDGYDVIETVARQPWVKGGKVGMVGLSYSGIAQLYAASTNPPHLAAITAQSVIADPWLAQWPGGIYNAGFTKQWLAQRDAEAAAGGVEWVRERIDGGDTTCAENLSLRSQNVDFESFGRSLEFRPDDAGERDLRELVRRIEAPVFLTGAFQDEQTGPVFTGMLDHFDSAEVLRVRLWNGRHPDGYSAMNAMSWFEFLELYVADEVPVVDPLVRVGMAPVLAETFGLATVELPGDRLAERFGDDIDSARAFYESEDPVEVVFENGAGGDEPGEPGGTFSARFESWPSVSASPATWWFGPGGALVGDAPEAGGADRFRHDAAAAGEDFFGESGYELFPPMWDIEWTAFVDDHQASYTTDPLANDVVLGGPGEVTLWVGSEADDADVQVALSEITPDGKEVLLQIGLLRVSHRAVDDERSAPMRVEHPFTAEAAAPIPAGEMVEARIALPSVAAPVRAGSRLRVTVSSPGRSHGTWLFESPFGDGEEPEHRVGWGGATPSSITLPVLDSLVDSVPDARPACGSLRGQPCRDDPAPTNVPG